MTYIIVTRPTCFLRTYVDTSRRGRAIQTSITELRPLPTRSREISTCTIMGITALVLNYDIGKRSRGGRRLKITGISIVNGAQTTGSIANLGDKPSANLQVAIRFVKSNK